MKVICIRCDNVFHTVGKYYDDEFKEIPEKYICLKCRAKEIECQESAG